MKQYIIYETCKNRLDGKTVYNPVFHTDAGNAPAAFRRFVAAMDFKFFESFRDTGRKAWLGMAFNPAYDTVVLYAIEGI